MVRRRPRPVKTTSDYEGASAAFSGLMAQSLEGAVAVAASKAKVLEDQYFASPKRKECKISGVKDNAISSHQNDHMLEKTCRRTLKTRKSPSSGKHHSERGCIAGRNIGVPLATRSQTRTIDNYFKAKWASGKSSKIKNDTTEQQKCLESTVKTITTKNWNDNIGANNEDQISAFPINLHASPQSLLNEYNCSECGSPSPPILQNQGSVVVGCKMHSEFNFDLGEETNDSEHTELSDEYSNASGGCSSIQAILPTPTISNLGMHCPLTPCKVGGDKTSSCGSTTENIFLQEPVLTLDVDKSPNQASSIKINKTLELEPIFSSPPGFSSSLLNGPFSKIVSLQCSPLKNCNSFFFDKQSLQTQSVIDKEQCVILSSDNDNSSCDSGVAFTTSTMSTFRDPLSPQPLISGPSVMPISRRHKPVTPHRIVCPSPKKTAPRTVSSAYESTSAGISSSGHKISASNDQLSPRKPTRGRPATGCSKTRRRLNQKPEEHQAPYLTKTSSETLQNVYDQNVVEHIDPGNKKDNMTNFENLQIIVDERGAGATQPACEIKSVQTGTFQILQQQHKPKPANKVHHKPAKAINNNKQSQQSKVKHHQAPNSHPLAATKTNNAELTEYFPVRRSVRKTKTAVEEEIMRNLEKAVLEQRAEGLKVAYFKNKGRGVVAERRFERGEFVIEYIGDLISMADATEREQQYALDDNAGCYMYYFKHKNQQYCIDATIDTGKLGRLVNHSRNGNLLTKVVVVKQRPHLILIAKDDIEPGEELTYDYGDRSKESLLHHPWLAF